jgi:competence protein ComEC
LRRGLGLLPKASAPGTFSPKIFHIITLLLLLLLLWNPLAARERLEITFLDVGQGDCILVQTGRETFLVDTGPCTEWADAGADVIVPWLARHGIRALDLVFLTHEDSDHTGGLAYVLANVPVKRLGVPEVGRRLALPRWQEILARAAAVGISESEILRLKAGDVLSFSSGLRLDLIGPVRVTSLDEDGANDHSLVFYLSYQGFTMLFTGDMGLPEMALLQERGDWRPADFIKVPHHGSKNSQDDAWWDHFAPRAVFIPVGAHNTFGHPAPVVLDYWAARNVPLYRTDTQGAVRLLVDSKGYRIETGV